MNDRDATRIAAAAQAAGLKKIDDFVRSLCHADQVGGQVLGSDVAEFTASRSGS